ncbi:DUF2256 domain-containing protein [Candidatus Pelagibacter sp.]|nr:DUF2256 domain-containing protein [Candidatus Pelagibacter sp.]
MTACQIGKIQLKNGNKILKKFKLKKENLPSKICPVCKRPFVWRKKWKLNWDKVKYCSKKCSK